MTPSKVNQQQSEVQHPKTKIYFQLVEIPHFLVLQHNHNLQEVFLVKTKQQQPKILAVCLVTLEDNLQLHQLKTNRLLQVVLDKQIRKLNQQPLLACLLIQLLRLVAQHKTNQQIYSKDNLETQHQIFLGPRQPQIQVQLNQIVHLFKWVHKLSRHQRLLTQWAVQNKRPNSLQ